MCPPDPDSVRERERIGLASGVPIPNRRKAERPARSRARRRRGPSQPRGADGLTGRRGAGEVPAVVGPQPFAHCVHAPGAAQAVESQWILKGQTATPLSVQQVGRASSAVVSRSRVLVAGHVHAVTPSRSPAPRGCLDRWSIAPLPRWRKTPRMVARVVCVCVCAPTATRCAHVVPPTPVGASAACLVRTTRTRYCFAV